LVPVIVKTTTLKNGPDHSLIILTVKFWSKGPSIYDVETEVGVVSGSGGGRGCQLHADVHTEDI